MNEWNSSRCVTEYYITLSLHMHGAGTHTHAGGGSRHTRVHTPRSAAAGRGQVLAVEPDIEEREHHTHRARGPPRLSVCPPT